MGLFDKFRKSGSMPSGAQTGKRNEIELDNKELKESIANAALSVLKQDEHYNNLAGLTVEFGYLFTVDGHGVEGLLKIITDKGIFYFAAQKTSVIFLDINEELFKAYTETFLEMHG